MKTKFFSLIILMGFAVACVAQAQSPTPKPTAQESPAGKRRAMAKAAATASPAASPAVSPSAKRGGKKAAATRAHPTPSPTPGKFNLGDLFKPRGSAATSAAAATPAPARGASAAVAANTPAPGGGHGLVWANTETHVYHREGSRFYGTTKKGKYMTEADAVKEGYKPAGGH
jgi:hypothetical protein